MRQTKRLLSVIGILLIAACTDNGIFNPLNNAAGTYTLTVYAGKTLPATFTVQPGDPQWPQYPNGATFVFTDGTFVLRNDGSFTETNDFTVTQPGQSAVPNTFSRIGTWNISGTEDLTLFIPAQNNLPALTDTGTLTEDANGRLTINYDEDIGGGTFESFEYKRQ
ncbi:MAG TPA: hypothetical protein VK648_02440 [Gemmatimonadaceae bacterium]|nr:hypothetical protein [Gemmatimonadaceae bacterium]